MYTVYGTQNNILNGQHSHIVIWLLVQLFLHWRNKSHLPTPSCQSKIIHVLMALKYHISQRGFSGVRYSIKSFFKCFTKEAIPCALRYPTCSFVCFYCKTLGY